MSLWQHYDKVITRMQADICRLIEEKAEIEACVEDLIAIRDQARAVHATGAACYNDTRTSVDRKKLSDLGLMVKESYKTIPSEFNGSEEEDREMYEQPAPPSREERIEKAAKKILGLRKDCLYCEDHGLCEAEISIVLTELMEGKP